MTRHRYRALALPGVVAIAIAGLLVNPGRVGASAKTIESRSTLPSLRDGGPLTGAASQLRAGDLGGRGTSTARYTSGPSDAAAGISSAQSSTGDAYSALTPTRLLDTRSSGGALGAGGTRNLTVTGLGGVPAGATAVALNVTATDATSSSYLSVYPAGSTQPTVSNLDWVKGQTLANLVMVPVGTGGQVTFYNHAGSVDVVVDLEGYFAPETAGDATGSYVPLTPSRIADTRPASGYPDAGSALSGGDTLGVQVTGAGGVPTTGVAAALVNVTVTDTNAASYLTVWPTGESRPLASNLNWPAGGTVANRVLVPVGPDGTISLYNEAGTSDAIVDVDGYFTSDSTVPGNASLFTPIAPVRILDSRDSIGPIGSAQSISRQVAGVDGTSADAVAAVTNLTAVDTTASSYFTVYPESTRPITSDVNWAPGEISSNLTVMTLSSSGTTNVYNHAGSADVLVDVFGYFTPLEAALKVTTTSLPAASTGTSYLAALGATGGVKPYSWTISSGALPSGLSLSPTGTISGTPTATGSYSFTVQVTDSTTAVPETATASLSITVGGGSSLTPTVITSGNWSGYAFGDGPYTSISGTFTVSSLESAPANSYMSEWVGIDGFGNQSLIQAGIDEYPDPHSPDLFDIQPWWEILPAAETPITTLTDIQPGDSITVSIDKVSGTEWSISLVDHTTGQSFSTEQEYNGPATSAEWIVEAPEVGNQIVTLAPFTPITFSQLTATGPESTLDEVIMKQSGNDVSVPSTFTANGFNVAYGSTQPAPPS